jgi:hypothetical protein
MCSKSRRFAAADGRARALPGNWAWPYGHLAPVPDAAGNRAVAVPRRLPSRASRDLLPETPAAYEQNGARRVLQNDVRSPVVADVAGVDDVRVLRKREELG